MVNRDPFQHTATRRWLLFKRLYFPPIARFNTQPPEGGCLKHTHSIWRYRVSTHSHPKVAAVSPSPSICLIAQFQHTATRRWLLFTVAVERWDYIVSTHSHPKVAARRNRKQSKRALCFNTQPPEGGCELC